MSTTHKLFKYVHTGKHEVVLVVQEFPFFEETQNGHILQTFSYLAKVSRSILFTLDSDDNNWILGLCLSPKHGNNYPHILSNAPKSRMRSIQLNCYIYGKQP